jgi:hypothetical protein
VKQQLSLDKLRYLCLYRNIPTSHRERLVPISIARLAPRDICNLVKEHGATQPEPAVLPFVTAPEVQVYCEGRLMTADNFLQKQQQQRGRPFKKGRFGNPAGRPRECRTDRGSCPAIARG